MVFIMLNKKSIGFGNVRLAWVPQELGQLGDLTLSLKGKLVYRTYNHINCQAKYKNTILYIPTELIDLEETRFKGCEAIIVTLLDYQYCFRFSSDADAVVFSRCLQQVEKIGRGLSNRELRDYKLIMSFGLEFGLIKIGPNEWDEDKNDDESWCLPWPVQSANIQDFYDCRCHEIGHKRYGYYYDEDEDD